MKILHCCLACFYIDHYSYQENLLPKYHKRMGYDVQIVASTETFDEKGRLTYTSSGEYFNEDGIKVTRLPYVSWMSHSIAIKLRRYIGLKEYLYEYQPDFIFLHDIQFLDVDIVRDYASKNKVVIVADSHSDFSNSARSFISRRILHGIIYKHCAKIIEPFVSRFYGVLPARVDFLNEMYDIPRGKIDLLVMGADDDLVREAAVPSEVIGFRNNHGVSEDDFLIVTGGKIDLAKTQTLLLMDAVNRINNPKVKLLIFGSVVPEMKQEFNQRLSEHVMYIGWVKSEDTYPIFASAQMVVFPGRHSVFWEQVCAQGIPMIVKRWKGTDDIDLDGNVFFLEKDSVEEIENAIVSNALNKNNYLKMKEVAASDRSLKFLYSSIARKSLEVLDNMKQSPS